MLIGPSGAGKSHWAAGRYRHAEIVSSDGLRAVVGSDEHDLDASADAFAVLDVIIAARMRRRLTTVVDTLGLDPVRRRGYLAQARSAGLPAVAVVFSTAAALCRQRNAARVRPVPAPVLRGQLARLPGAVAEIDGEGWDRQLLVSAEDGDPASGPADVASRAAAGSLGPRPQLEFVLQLSRFPWGKNPAAWLAAIAGAAEEAGFSGLALMDHLIQIPQVDRAWEPIPEPFVTLGLLAARTTKLRLSTLVSPATFRPAGIIAKTVATLDALSGGRAFLGIGAGWWEREHAAYGLALPPVAERMDRLEAAIETIRALWAPGTKAYRSDRVQLPETTGYPRPTGTIPIIVGGAGEQRTLRIAARLGDACNLPSSIDVLDRKIAVLRQRLAEVGRDPAEVAITVLDIPLVGDDREQVAEIVARLRGRTSAAAFAERHHAGTAADQVARYRQLAERGVSTVFVALPDLEGPAQLERFAQVNRAFAG